MKKIFISSTFRDMNEERDLFHEQICPQLNDIARQYGESISFCDLRWGVDTTTLETEEGARRVLSVCLDEIDRCKPYMVVLLGERYGWIPSKALIDETVKMRRGFALEELEKSVTALEIEYGSLSRADQLDRTLFYFRQMEGMPPEDYTAEDEDHARRLAQLKQRIIQVTDGRVKTYQVSWDRENQCIRGLDAFARMVTEDIQGLMAGEWQQLAAQTPYEKDQHGQWELAQQKSAQFAARFELLQTYLHRIEADTRCFAIQGPSGCGKSTVMSRIAVQLRAQGEQVFIIFCGSTGLCSTALDVVQYVVNILETALQLQHFADIPRQTAPSFSEWQDHLEKLVARYTAQKKERMVILLDGVDQLLADPERDGLRFVPLRLTDRIRVILSCLDSFPINRDIPVETVPALEQTDREDVVRGILAPTGRMLSDEVINVVAAKEGGEKPLYLSLLVTRLEMMDGEDFARINQLGGGMDAINREQIKIIKGCASGLEQLCVELLAEAARKLGSNLPFVAAKYLAVSRHGLRESDLEGIFRILGQKWDALRFARFRRYMSRFFYQRQDGRLDFSHKSFRSGFLETIEDRLEYDRVLLAQFKSLPHGDDVRMREIVHHCILADDKQFLVDYTSKLEEDDTLAIQCAGKDATALALLDGGAWFCELIEDPQITGKDHTFYTFFMLSVLENNPESYEAMRLSCKCYETIFANAEQLSCSSRGRVLLNLGRYKLANTYIVFGGMDNFLYAIELMKLSMEDMDRPWDEMDEETVEMVENNRLNILSLYRHMANLCLSIGRKQNIEEAIKLLFTALDRAEILRKESNSDELQFRIAALYHSLGNAFWRLDSEANLEKSYDYTKRACGIFEKLPQKEERSNCLDMLVRTYSQMVTILSHSKEPEDLEQAFAYARKALWISEEQMRANGSIEDRERLAGSIDTLAGLYRNKADSDSLQEANRLLKRVIALQETVSSELNTESAWSDLCAYYYTAAGILTELTGEDNLHEAEELYRKGIAIAQECGRLQDTPVILQLQVAGLLALGIVLEAFGTQQSVSEAASGYETAIELSRRILDNQDTDTVYLTLRRCYNRLGRLLEKLGLLAEAALCYQEKAELDRLRLEKTGAPKWAEYYSISLTNLCNLCMDLEGTWLETALASYLEHLKLHEIWLQKDLQLLEEDDYRVILGNIAWIYENTDTCRDFAKAVEFRLRRYQKEKARAEMSGDPEALRDQALACRRVVVACKKLEDMPRACTYAKEAKELWDSVVHTQNTEKNRWNLSLCYGDLGEIYLAMGDRAAAMDAWLESLSLREALVEEFHSELAREGLIVSLQRVAGHPDTQPEYRMRLLKQAMHTAQELFAQTQKEEHRNYIEQLQKAMEEASS